MESIYELMQASQLRALDVLGAGLGLLYIWLEYRASIWLWAVSVVMPLVDMMLYFRAGLYADFAMAIYYALAAVYGYLVWRCGRRKSDRRPLAITHMGWPVAWRCAVVMAVLWAVIWAALAGLTDSTVPLRDSFTTALSMIALWALAHKLVEQWALWLVVDIVSCWLYVQKGIPFKALLYGLYVVIAVMGWRKWARMASVS